MRSTVILGPALLAVSAGATNPHFNFRLNSSVSSTSSLSSSTPTLSFSSSESLETNSESNSSVDLIATTSTSPESTFSSATSTSTSSGSASSISSSASTSVSANSTTSASATVGLSSSSSSPNSTSLASTNGTTSAPAICTGCVLEAINPITLSFDETSVSGWTATATETLTLITQTFEYIDTVVMEVITMSQNQTVAAGGTANSTLAYFTTPMFTWVAADDVTLTLAAGPTYVAYLGLYGGLDYNDLVPTETAQDDMSPTETADDSFFPTETEDYSSETCDATVSNLRIQPTQAADYSYYIETYASGAPANTNYGPMSLPPAIIDHLKQLPEITDFFNGSDIATCTLRPTYAPSRTTAYTLSGIPPQQSQPGQVSSEYVSTSYITTSQHVSIDECLRCSTPDNGSPGPTQIQDPVNPPDNSGTPDTTNNENQNQNQNQNQDQNQQQSNGKSITIGDSTYDVHPAQPTGENTQNPGLVIGSQTLTAGETATINGVPVVVPTEGGGSKVVIDGSTIGVAATGALVLTVGTNTITANSDGQFVIGSQTLNPGSAITVDGSTLSLGPSGTVAVINGVTQTLGNAPGPTAAHVLTVGDQTITANSEGQFVIGSQTLSAGGSAIVVDGSTLSLGPSGTIAVVNGVTQTLGNALPTGMPVLTVGNKEISATIIGGTTQFVLADGQTLTAGGVLTIDGTTYSMPKDGSGSTVVVNGVTSTLDSSGLPVITMGSQSITASVIDGTTAFVLGDDQTLTPGGVITVDGTTYSMPKSASGSVVVINGVTSTLGEGPMTSAPDLTINGKTYSATVRDGTAEYVIASGTTLKPGEAITISGTTYSLDKDGTALVINGQTSTVSKVPASNSATTTKSSSRSMSSGASSGSGSSSTTSELQPGNFIASGLGITDKEGRGTIIRAGLDKWVEGMVIGFAGWVIMLL